MASVRWETRLASDVAQLPRNNGQFPEKRFRESEKIGVLQSSLRRVGITGQSSEHADECLRLTEKVA